MLEQQFKQRYLESLSFYKYFYDDVREYGSSDKPRRVFYFIPGFSGVAGQVRFIFPNLHALYGNDFYVRCCHLDAFSASKPIWEKYTTANLDARRTVIVADIKQLLDCHGEVVVLVSSNGFYDFVYAFDELASAAAEGRLKLLWGACAPDHFDDTLWESVFFGLNGFVHGGHRWFAYPNHNLLTAFNPETSTSLRWRFGSQAKTIHKVDLESRFVFANLYWDYVSVGCFNAMLDHMLRHGPGPIDIEAHVLVGANDGYWQGQSEDQVRAAVGKYLTNATYTFKPTSHLWVMTPENVAGLFDRLEGGAIAS
jgi:pimeloyl-ACP methyl ester carboxylesterase